MLCTLGQYIVNVQGTTTSEGFLTILTFGIRFSAKILNKVFAPNSGLVAPSGKSWIRH